MIIFYPFFVTVTRFFIDLMMQNLYLPTEAQLEEVHLQRPEWCYKNVQPEIEARVKSNRF